MNVPRRPGHLVLVGMAGSGKTTVGHLLAGLTGRRFVDTDASVEQACGERLVALFEHEGEAGFRRREQLAVAEALTSPEPAVVAVGGGAVADAESRRRIGGSADAVWLRAQPATLARRLGDGSGRPLLADPGALGRLDAERRPHYLEVARFVVDVDDLDPASAAAAVHDAVLRRITVAVAPLAYEVIVGPGAARLLRSLVPESARRAALVAEKGRPLEVETGLEEHRFFVDSGEGAKSLRTVEALCRGFAVAGLHRGDVVVAVGGGVVTDVCGFAASCYHRGVAVVHVPTTLLGQVDAAVGGKTAVNLPEGKNLVGSFHQPRAVLCDVDALVTLPERQWRSGLGEVAKYVLSGLVTARDGSLTDLVADCVRAKAALVAEDERDEGRRLVLNYGHTLAHALEAERWSAYEPIGHGEAVGIGLVFAARLARALGRVDDEEVDRHLGLVSGFGLHTALPSGVHVDDLLVRISRDKKADATMRFVLLGPNGPEPVADVPSEVVRATLAEMTTTAGGEAA